MPSTNTINGVDLDRLSSTVAAITADPSLAQFEFRASNQWLDGGHSRTTIQGFYGVGQEDTTRTEAFTIDADEPVVLLGRNQAPNAGEYLLQALAACVTGTVVYHAAARGIVLESLQCTVHGDVDLQGFLDLDAAVQPGFERIRVTITAAGDFDDEQFAQLAELAQFSPVRDTISRPVPVAVDLIRG